MGSTVRGGFRRSTGSDGAGDHRGRNHPPSCGRLCRYVTDYSTASESESCAAAGGRLACDMADAAGFLRRPVDRCLRPDAEQPDSTRWTVIKLMDILFVASCGRPCVRTIGARLDEEWRRHGCTEATRGVGTRRAVTIGSDRICERSNSVRPERHDGSAGAEPAPLTRPSFPAFNRNCANRADSVTSTWSIRCSLDGKPWPPRVRRWR